MTQIFTAQSAPAEANLDGERKRMAEMPPTFARSNTIFLLGPPSTSQTMIFESSPPVATRRESGAQPRLVILDCW
jgi:hypothetical protein